MSELVVTKNILPSSSDSAIQKVRQLEVYTKQEEQVNIVHQHILHGGMYARSIMIPAGVLLTGVVIKVPTILIIDGCVRAFINGETKEISGYNTFAASANRKQAFLALEDTCMTMLFTSQAKTVEQAEEEFTDEAHLLMSRQEGAYNPTTITGE